jgi:large subunit ribosomal protein L28
MARKCDICGKGSVAGHNVPRKGLPRKRGGAGQNIGVKTKRVFKPNLVRVRAKQGTSVTTMRVCTRCLRSGKIQKA